MELEWQKNGNTSISMKVQKAKVTSLSDSPQSFLFSSYFNSNHSFLFKNKFFLTIPFNVESGLRIENKNKIFETRLYFNF
jgi:hypothetical protein